MEAVGAGGFEQHGRSGDEDDLGAAEHLASDERCSELKCICPAQAGAVEELAGGFEDGWIEGLLHHASGFDAEDFKGCRSIFGTDVAGTLATPYGSVDFKRR